MDKGTALLMAMAPARGAEYTPVQIQKLMFLIDRELARYFNGEAFFDFQPYDYGPFDRAVYDTLKELESEGLVESMGRAGLPWRKYRTTDQGCEQGSIALKQQDGWVRDGIQAYSEWVRRLTFGQLVSAIYAKYPEMKVNSVFRG